MRKAYLFAPFNSASKEMRRAKGTFSMKLSWQRVRTYSGSVVPLVESVVSPMYLVDVLECNRWI